MKTYNQTNFFKHTFCEFKEVTNFKIPDSTNYKSKSTSIYYYSEEGVYRKSNHWGRVANCRWKLIDSKNYKNQEIVIGFAKWSDFHPINTAEKLFFITIDYENKTAKMNSNKNTSTKYLYTYYEAQKRVKQATHLLKNNKWAEYFDSEIDELRFKILSEFINSDKSLQEIKNEQK